MLSATQTKLARSRRASYRTKHIPYKADSGVQPLADEWPAVSASVLLLAACGPFNEAKDGPTYGVFTEALRAAWPTASKGTYEQLRDSIEKKILQGKSGSFQRPVLFAIPGTESFRTETIFTTG